MFSQPKEDIMHMESKDYNMGYQNSIMEVQRQYNLRNRNVPINAPKNLKLIHLPPAKRRLILQRKSLKRKLHPPKR